MTRLWAVLLLVLSLSWTGCYISDEDLHIGCIDGEGPLVTETLNVADFEFLSLELSADMFLTEGPEFEVIVEGKPNIIDQLDLSVRNGHWNITTDRCVRDLGPMKFFITMPHLRRLDLASSGNVRSENLLHITNLELNIFGSGDMDLAIEGRDLDVGMTGSGDIRLEGLAEELDYDVYGSGDLRAFSLDLLEADVQVHGSGDVDVRVAEWLKVRIEGSGDVRFRGNPNLDVNITGSGSLIDAN